MEKEVKRVNAPEEEAKELTEEEVNLYGNCGKDKYRCQDVYKRQASNCWSLSSNHSIRTASSSVLSRRHTTVTTLFDTLLLSSTKCVC